MLCLMNPILLLLSVDEASLILSVLREEQLNDGIDARLDSVICDLRALVHNAENDRVADDAARAAYFLDAASDVTFANSELTK